MRWKAVRGDIYRVVCMNGCLANEVIDNLSFVQLSDPMKEATLQIICKQSLATGV